MVIFASNACDGSLGVMQCAHFQKEHMMDVDAMGTYMMDTLVRKLHLQLVWT